MVAEPSTFPVNTFFFAWIFANLFVLSSTWNRHHGVNLKTTNRNIRSYFKVDVNPTKLDDSSEQPMETIIQLTEWRTRYRAHLVDLKFMTAFVIQTNDFVCNCVIE